MGLCTFVLLPLSSSISFFEFRCIQPTPSEGCSVNKRFLKDYHFLKKFKFQIAPLCIHEKKGRVFFSMTIEVQSKKRLGELKFKGVLKLNSVVGDLLKYTNPSHAKGHIMHTMKIKLKIPGTQWVGVLE